MSQKDCGQLKHLILFATNSKTQFENQQTAKKSNKVQIVTHKLMPKPTHSLCEESIRITWHNNPQLCVSTAFVSRLNTVKHWYIIFSVLPSDRTSTEVKLKHNKHYIVAQRRMSQRYHTF
jgi:hypothetical protein